MSVIDFFKKIIEVKNDDLSFLNVGDIIWARRYKTEEEKNKMKQGHRESPYLIIKKKGKRVWALMETSNPHQEVKWNMLYYPLGRLSYNMKKNSYISCLKVYELKEIQFVETIGHIKDYDLNQIKKHLYIVKNSEFPYKPDIEDKYLDFEIAPGDIIKFDKDKYYIQSIDDEGYNVYRLKNRLKKGHTLYLNNTYYCFTCILNKIKKSKKYQLINTFNTGEIEIINNYINEEKNKQIVNIENRKNMQIGSLVKYNDNHYYLYDEDDTNFYLCGIIPESLPHTKVGIFKIDGGLYKTLFAKIAYPKNKFLENNYKIKRVATSEEIIYNNKIMNMSKSERIRENKMLYAKANILENKIRSINDYVPMVVIKNKNNGFYYLITSRNENIIDIVNINNFSDSFSFILEEETNPFVYYRILSREEYKIYMDKINELNKMISSFEINK